jgi:hypothetical protein
MCPVSKRLNVPSGGYDDPSLIEPVEIRPVGHIKLAAAPIAIAVPSVTVHHAGTTADRRPIQKQLARGHWQVNKRSASACARVSHEANFLCTPPISA